MGTVVYTSLPAPIGEQKALIDVANALDAKRGISPLSYSAIPQHQDAKPSDNQAIRDWSAALRVHDALLATLQDDQAQALMNSVAASTSFDGQWAKDQAQSILNYHLDKHKRRQAAPQYQADVAQKQLQEEQIKTAALQATLAQQAMAQPSAAAASVVAPAMTYVPPPPPPPSGPPWLLIAGGLGILGVGGYFLLRKK